MRFIKGHMLHGGASDLVLKDQRRAAEPASDLGENAAQQLFLE
jgi:hypothetical protein